MRRLIALFVVALLGATIYGISSSSSGVSVDHQTVSGSELRAELSDISLHPGLACFIGTIAGGTVSSGAGGDTVKIAGAAAWANIRLEGLAIDRYVETKLKHVPTKSQLATGKADLESEMTQEAAQNSVTCPGTASAAIAEMAPEMRQIEIAGEADSLYLVTKIKKSIPLTTASEQSFYNQHKSSYDTLCISLAVVSVANLPAFEESQQSGMSVAQLAKKYSEDSSGASGGAYGCYGPTADGYSNIRADVANAALGSFPTEPLKTSYGGATAALYVAVTSRTTTPFAKAQSAVLADLQTVNAEAANQLKNGLLYAAAVHVDPSFGIWGASSSVGLSVFVPSLPKKSSVDSTSTLTTPSSSSYQ